MSAAADAKVASFLAVTAFKGDRGVAQRCLAAAGNNVDEAIGLFFSMGAQAFAAPSSSSSSAAASASSSSAVDPVAAAALVAATLGPAATATDFTAAAAAAAADSSP
jgi:hypothetical protein